MGFDTIYGVDFSGSSTAGEKIWITEVDLSDDEFQVKTVERIDRYLDLPSRSRETVLQELQREIRESSERTAFGLDFPFSLPEEILIQEDWLDFLVRFPDEFLSPENLQRVCSDRARLVTDGDDVQLYRCTEQGPGALCPYNAQIRLQTYYGIRDLLRPLALSGSARIPPIVTSLNGTPTVIEVYPSATIQARSDIGPSGYKSNSESAREKREQLVEEFLPESSDVTSEQLIDDTEADGIDSVIAARAVYENKSEILQDETDEGVPVEGQIYA